MEVSNTPNVNISPETARQKANRFLSEYVTLMAQAGKPVVLSKNPPIWQIPAYLHLPKLGNVGNIGTIYVDALTGVVISLTEAEITQMQEIAHAIVNSIGGL